MNLRTFLFAVASLVAVQAAVTYIDHDQVQPFAQPKPSTVSEKVAVMYKPQLSISIGSQPYPAVQADGAVSAGLRGAGPYDGECTGSTLGSQVYARSDWYKEKWATVYAWYFPKGRRGKYGARHSWKAAVVWIDNPASLKNSTIIGVSMRRGFRYKKAVPPLSEYVDGASVKLELYSSYLVKRALRLTESEGEFQDLITWEQLTDEARTALSTADFGPGLIPSKTRRMMPLKDGVFEEILKDAWPF